MKQNGECRVSYCGECPDIEINYGKGYRCRKLNITKEFSEDLFSICRLPEIMERKVFFEKRPELGADIFDMCVYCSTDRSFPWLVEIKKASATGTYWEEIASYGTKGEAEGILGCKIPELVKL